MDEGFEVKKVSDSEWVVVDKDLDIEVASYGTEAEAIKAKQSLELD